MNRKSENIEINHKRPEIRMQKINRVKSAGLVAACAALLITTTASKAADLHPSVNILPIHANAGVTAVLTNGPGPGAFIAAANGVVQSSLLGTCVENAQL